MSRTMYKFLILTMLSIFGILLFGCSSSESKSQQTAPAGTTLAAGPTAESKQYSAPPAMQIDPNKKYTAIMETEKGTISIELFAKDAPKTVNNFVFLSREGFYNGTTFHRVIPGFMAQGGDPTGTGMGDPGYKFEDEISDRKHVTGALSMANSGANTNGSQFFICYAPQSHLNGKHTVFGQVTKGMDVLNRLTARDPNKMPNFSGDKIIKITIEESN